MIRIESANPATSSRVSGVAFAPHPDPERRSKVSEPVAEDVADRLCGLPGYSRCTLSDAEADAFGLATPVLMVTSLVPPNGATAIRASLNDALVSGLITNSRSFPAGSRRGHR